MYVHPVLFMPRDANATCNHNHVPLSAAVKIVQIHMVCVYQNQKGWNELDVLIHFRLPYPLARNLLLNEESLSTSICSDFESIVLDEIPSNHQEILSTTDMANTYVYYSKSTFCTLPLEAGIIFREKTNIQISSKIEFMNKRTLY